MNATKPNASIVVPAYNVSSTIVETLHSLLVQTFTDFEIIVVDDGSRDDTCELVEGLNDKRIRIVRQANRGLAGAHNTGIHEAQGRYIGFCDADDLWLPEKLELHIAHLDNAPDVGISFAGSQMIDAKGKPLGLNQSPKLTGITPAHVFKRNPIGNGSSAVIRRTALAGFAYRPYSEKKRDWYFDETYRQSDDIEGWLRFAITGDWRIEGIPGHLTLYRIHTGGLSANVEKQYATWQRMKGKIAAISPALVAKHGPAAEAYQLRYLARRAVSMRDGKLAASLARRAFRTSLCPLLEEPIKTIVTWAAAEMLNLLGQARYEWTEQSLLGQNKGKSS